jgi:hypothetical protein
MNRLRVLRNAAWAMTLVCAQAFPQPAPQAPPAANPCRFAIQASLKLRACASNVSYSGPAKPRR